MGKIEVKKTEKRPPDRREEGETGERNANKTDKIKYIHFFLLSTPLPNNSYQITTKKLVNTSGCNHNILN